MRAIKRTWSPAGRVALALVVLALSGCPAGEGEAGVVPDGWSEVRAGELVYAVPGDFTEADPPRDPERTVEHLRGDPDDPSRLELVGVYENPPTTTTGDEFPLWAYSAEMFGVRGHLVEGARDLSVDKREDLAVEGAQEAELLTVTHFEPQLDEQVVQTVVLVRTETAIYDLRYLAVADLVDADIASTLVGTVRVR